MFLKNVAKTGVEDKRKFIAIRNAIRIFKTIHNEC
jgi:hypothetical protein